MPLPFDPHHATQHLATADAVMGGLIERVGPPTLEVDSLLNPFQALTRSIVYQQLSGKAAATIFGRVEALFPDGGLADPEQVLAMPESDLRGAGLSRAKTAAIKDLARHVEAGTIPPLDAIHAMQDETLVERFVQVRGIGPWTAQMFLIFRLGRPDVLPVTDLGVRTGFMYTYGTDDLPTAAALTAHAEPWRPYRTLASWYLWRAVDLARAKE